MEPYTANVMNETLNRAVVMSIGAITVNAIYRDVSEPSVRPAPPMDAGQ
jgi:hypothetical protein